jgi:hypothetical protein
MAGRLARFGGFEHLIRHASEYGECFSEERLRTTQKITSDMTKK